MHVVFDIAGYLYFDQNTVFPVKIRLIFCIKFLVLSHLTCDLSEAKKKINVDSEEMHKMMSILRKTVEVIIILSVAQLITTIIFFTA